MYFRLGNSYGDTMKISERGQITIPKRLRDSYGLGPDVEVEITPTDEGLLIHKRAVEAHPVDRVYGILVDGGSTAERADHANASLPTF